jgi:hypothetical protein
LRSIIAATGVAVLVVERRRVEVGAQALDERRRHLQLLRAQLDVLVEDVELGSRTSSGHSIVCSTIALPRTRSSAMLSRCRSATLTTAIRSVSTSASRSSA